MERRPNNTLDRSGGSVFLQVTYFHSRLFVIAPPGQRERSAAPLCQNADTSGFRARKVSLL